jgi:pyruvate dehydrogenase phosphatase
MKEFPHDRDILVEDRGVHYLKGQLQPTKSLGDYRLKKKELWRGKGKFNGPYLTHEPDVRTFPIRSTDQCIVIASDGIWDFVDKWSVSQLSLQPQPHELILN